MRRDTAVVVSVLLIIALSLTLFVHNVTGNVILRTFSNGNTFHVVKFEHAGVDTSTYITIPKNTDVFYGYLVIQPVSYKGSYPTNVKIDVGGDGFDYVYKGEMVSPQKIDLKKAIGSKRGKIPIVIVSDTPGELILKDLEISYGVIKEKGIPQNAPLQPNFFNYSYFDNFLNDSNVDYSKSKNIEVKNGVKGVSSFFPGFKYKTPINISNPNDELTNYQVKLIVPYNSHMNSNYSDLRFSFKYPNGTEVEIPYWIQSYNSSSATVWVKVPDLKTGNTTIYMYYGNPNATSKSNGDAVFIFFDDFNGNSLNSTKWYVVRKQGNSYYTVSNSILTLYGPSGTSASGLTIRSLNQYGYNYTIVAKIIQDTNYNGKTTDLGFGGVTTATSPWWVPNTDNFQGYYGGSGSGSNGPRSCHLINYWTGNNNNMNINCFGTPQIISITKLSSETILNVGSKYVNSVDVPQSSGYIVLNTGAGWADSSYRGILGIDWIFVKKYASTEPTVIFGSEESASVNVNGTLITKPISFPISISQLKSLEVNVSGNVSFSISSEDMSKIFSIGETNTTHTFDLSNINVSQLGQHPRLIANLSKGAVLYSWNLSISGSDDQPPNFTIPNFIETSNNTYSFNVSDFSGVSSCWINYNGQNVSGSYQNGKCNLDLSNLNYSRYQVKICSKDRFGNSKCQDVNLSLYGKIARGGTFSKSGNYKVLNDVEQVEFTKSSNVDFKNHKFTKLIIHDGSEVKNAELMFGKIINRFDLYGKNINISSPFPVSPPKNYTIIQLIHVDGGSNSQLQINFTRPIGYKDVSIYEYHNGHWNKLQTRIVGNKLVSQTITSFSDIGVLGVPAEDWPMEWHDIQHTSLSPSLSVSPEVVNKIYNSSGELEGILTIYNGTAFVYEYPKGLIAVNIKNSQLLWNSTNLYGNVPQSAFNGILYIAGDSLYAVNITNGQIIWNTSANCDGFYSIPEVYNNTLFVIDECNNLYAFYLNGSIKWEKQISGNEVSGVVDFTPAIYNNLLFVPYWDSLHEINLSNNEEIWNISYNGVGEVLPPTIYNNLLVYFFANNSDNNGANGDLFVWNISDNNLVWSERFLGVGTNDVAPPIYNNLVYIWNNSNLFALYLSNGTVKWNKSVNNLTHSIAISSDGVLYFGSKDNLIYALNATTGGTLWTLSFNETPYSPILYKKMLLFYTPSSLYVVGDSFPPSVTINFPQNQTYSRVSLINATVTDNDQVDKVIAEIDSQTNVTLVNEPGTNYYYNDTINLPNGYHTIKIYAYDPSGNLNDSESVSFTVNNIISNCPFVINISGSYEINCPIINSTTGAPGYGVLVNTSNVNITCISPTTIVSPDTSFISVRGDNVSIKNCTAYLQSNSKVIKLNTTNVSVENLKILSNGNYTSIIDNLLNGYRGLKNVSIEQPSNNVIEIKGSKIDIENLNAGNLTLKLLHQEDVVNVNNLKAHSLILSTNETWGLNSFLNKANVYITNSSIDDLRCDIKSDCYLSNSTVKKIETNSSVSTIPILLNQINFVKIGGYNVGLNVYNAKINMINKVTPPPNTTVVGPIFNLTPSYGNNAINIWEDQNPYFIPGKSVPYLYEKTPKNVSMLVGEYYHSVNIGDSYYRSTNTWQDSNVSQLEIIKYNSSGDVVARLVIGGVPNLYPSQEELLSDGQYLYFIYLSSGYPSNSFHVMKLDRNLKLLNDVEVTLPVYNIDWISAALSDNYLFIGEYVYNNDTGYNYTLFKFDKNSLEYNWISKHLSSGFESINAISASNNGVVVSYLYSEDPNTYYIDSYSNSLELLGRIITTNLPNCVLEFNNSIYVISGPSLYNSTLYKYSLYLNQLKTDQLPYFVDNCVKYNNMLVAGSYYGNLVGLFMYNTSNDKILNYEYNFIPSETFGWLSAGYKGFGVYSVNDDLYVYKTVGAGDYLENFYFEIKNWTQPDAMTKMSYSKLCVKFNDSLFDALRDAKSNVQLLSFWKEDGDKWSKIPSTFNLTTMTLCTDYRFTSYSNVTVLASEDFTPPSVKFIYPTAGYYSSNITKLQLNISDPSGISTAFVQIGQTRYNLQYNSTTGYWENHNLNLGPGSYTACAWANDTYGNVNNSVCVSFTVLNVNMSCDNPNGLYVKYAALPQNPNAGAPIYLYGIVCNGTTPMINKDVWFFYQQFPVQPVVVANWTWENATRSDPIGSWGGWRIVGDFEDDFAPSWTSSHPFDRFFTLGHLSKYCAKMYNSFADHHGYLYHNLNVYADSVSFYIKYSASTSYGSDRISAVVTLSDGEKYHFILHTHGFTIPSNSSTDYYFDYRNDSYFGIWRPVVLPIFEIQKSLHPGTFYKITNLSFEIETSGYDSSHGVSMKVDDVYLYNYTKIKTSSDGTFGLKTKAFPYVRNITSYVHVDYNPNSSKILENSTEINIGNAFTITINPSQNNIQPNTPINISGRAVYVNGNSLPEGLPYKIFLDGEIQSIVWNEIGSFDFENNTTEGWDYFGNSPGYETSMEILTDNNSFYDKYLSLKTVNIGGWRYIGGLSLYLPSKPGYIDKIDFHFKPMSVTTVSWMEFDVQVDDRGVEKTLHFYLHNDTHTMPPGTSTDKYIYLDHTTVGNWSGFMIEPYSYQSFIRGKKIFRIMFSQGQAGGGSQLQFGIDRISFLQGRSGSLGADGNYLFTKVDNSKLTPGGHWIGVEITDQQGITIDNQTYLQVLPVLINITSPTNGSLYKNVWLNVTSNSYMKYWGYELDGKWYKLIPGETGVGETGFNISLSGLSDGLHKIKVNGTTLSGAYNETGYVYFYVDNTPPKVYLVSPPNNSLIMNSTFNLTFKAVDGLSKKMNCTLYVNDSAYTINNVPNGTNYNFTITLSDGSYAWGVNCTDQVGNWNVSDVWHFTVNAVPPGVFVSSISPSYPIYSSGYVVYTNESEENVSVNFYNADWWDKEWKYRMPLSPPDISSVKAVYGMFVMDTANLIKEGKMNSNCSDIRIVGEYENNSEIGSRMFFESLPYHVVNCDSKETKIYFEAPQRYYTYSSSIDLWNLFVYYGNPNAQSKDDNKIVEMPTASTYLSNVTGDVVSYPDGIAAVYNKSTNEIGLKINKGIYSYKACSNYNNLKIAYGNGKFYVGYSYDNSTIIMEINATTMDEIKEFNLSSGELYDIDVYDGKLRAVLVNSTDYKILIYDDSFNSVVKRLSFDVREIPFSPMLVQFIQGTKYLEFYNYDLQEAYLYVVNKTEIKPIGIYPGFVFRNGTEIDYLNVDNTQVGDGVYSEIFEYSFNGELKRSWKLPSLYEEIFPTGVICGGTHCIMFDYELYAGPETGFELSDVEEPEIFDIGTPYVSGAYYNDSFLVVIPGSIQKVSYSDLEYEYGLTGSQTVNDLDSVWYIIKNDTQILQNGTLASGGDIFSNNFTVNLSNDGDYYVQIYANDTVGHKSQVDMRIIKDTTPPAVSMNVLHSGDYILVNYTSSDRNLDYCEYYINGTYVSRIPCTGELNITPEMVGTGTFDIEVVAYDKAGNKGNNSVLANINCVSLNHKVRFDVINLDERTQTIDICRGNYTFNGNGSLIEGTLPTQTIFDFNNSVISGSGSLINVTGSAPVLEIPSTVGVPVLIENAKIINLTVWLNPGSALVNDTFINSSNAPGYEELFGIVCPSCYLGDNLTFINSPILLDKNVRVSGSNITYNGRPILIDTNAQNKLIKSNDEYGSIYLFNTNNTTIEVNLTNGGFLFVDGIGDNTDNVVINNSNIINSKGLVLNESGYSWVPGTLVENSRIINNTVGIMFLDNYDLKMNNSIIDKNKYVVGSISGGYIRGGDKISPGPSIIGGANKSGNYWQMVQEYDYDGDGIGSFPYDNDIYTRWGGDVEIYDEYPLANMTFHPEPTSSSDWITEGHDLHNTYASSENGAENYNKILFTKDSVVAPVIADGKLFTVEPHSPGVYQLVASDPNTGKEIWRTQLSISEYESGVPTSLQYHSGIICVSEELQRAVSCYNATNGKWIMPSSEHDVLINDTLVMFNPGYEYGTINVGVANVSTGKMIYSYSYSGYTVPQTVYDNNVVYYYSPEYGSPSEVGFINVSDGTNETWDVNLTWNGNSNWIGIKYYDGYAYFFGTNSTDGKGEIMRMNTTGVYPVVEVNGIISEFWKKGDVLEIVNYTGNLLNVNSSRVEYNLTSHTMKVVENLNGGLMYYTLNPDGSIKIERNVTYGKKVVTDVCGNTEEVQYTNMTIGGTKLTFDDSEDIPDAYVWQNKTYVWVVNYSVTGTNGKVYVFGKATIIPNIYVAIYGPGTGGCYTQQNVISCQSVTPLVSDNIDKAGVNLGEVPLVGAPYFVRIHVTDVSGAPLSNFPVEISEVNGNSLFAVSSKGYSFNGMIINTSDSGDITLLIAPTGYNLNGYKIKIGTPDNLIYGLVYVNNSKKIMNVTNYEWSGLYCNQFKDKINYIAPYIQDVLNSAVNDVYDINSRKSIHYNVSITPNGITVVGPPNTIFYNAINEFNITAPPGWKVSLVSNRPCVFIGSQGYGVSVFTYQSNGSNVFVDFDPIQPPTGVKFNVTLIATNGTITYSYTFTKIENGALNTKSSGIEGINYVSPIIQNLLTLAVNLNNNINLLNNESICGR